MIALLRRDGLALLLLLPPVLVVLWPVLGAPGSTVLGGSFLYGHLWSWEMLASRGLELSTQAINYPDGGSMTLIGWSFILPLLLLRALGLGLVAATNLLLLLHLLLGCFLAYRLMLQLTRHFSASLAGGAAYGLCPLVLSLVHNGQYPKLVHGLLPLLLLELLLLARGRRWPVLALGPTLALLCASSPYQGIFGALLALAGGAWMLARGPGGGVRLTRGAALLRLGLAALLAVVVTAPYLYYWQLTGGARGQLLVPAGTGMKLTAMADFRASAGGWFDPHSPAVAGDNPYLWDVIHVHYLGFFGLALAALAVVLRLLRGGTGKGPGPLTFAALGLGFVMLAHGPYLDLGPWRLPLPMQWIWDTLPASRAFYATYRAAVVVSLVLAVVAAMGLARLATRLGPRAGHALCAVAGLAMLLEVLLLSPAPFPIKASPAAVPPVYHDLARARDCGALLVVPYGVHDESLALERHRYHQTVHRHPLVHGVIKTPRRRMGQFHDGLYQAISGHAPPPLRRARAALERLHFRYVVLHEQLIRDPQRLPAIRAFLDRTLKLKRVYPGDGIRLYETLPFHQGKGGPQYPRSPGLPRVCL